MSTAPIRFLVAGTAITESIVHHPQGGSRTRLGGVAATMAIALAQAAPPHTVQQQHSVTLITQAGADEAGEQTRRLLAREQMETIMLDGPNPSGEAIIETMRGEQSRARGKWPHPSRVAQHAAQLAPEFDCTIIDCTLSPKDIR